MSIPEAMDTSTKAKEKRLINKTHSYACKGNNGEECDSKPNAPTKTLPKKKKRTSAEEEMPLSQVQENIIQFVK